LIAVVLQVNVEVPLLLVIPAVGVAVFSLMVISAEAVHPLAAVAVTE
jgi:hypothetical protein